MRFGLRMPNSEKLRVARDGGAYTWKEFQKHYSKKVALKRWQEASPVANSASQPAEEVRCASDAVQHAVVASGNVVGDLQASTEAEQTQEQTQAVDDQIPSILQMRDRGSRDRREPNSHLRPDLHL